MLKSFKKGLFFVFVTLTSVNCNGQADNNAFNGFLKNFEVASLPLNAIEFIVEKEGNLASKYIVEKDFEMYLRGREDGFWKFEDKFEFRYGGKLKVDELWFVFYSRTFFSADINKQISEIVLVSFSQRGELLSTLPIAGGYGDSITFSSVILDFDDIKLNFKLYLKEKVSEYTKSYFIDNNGAFKSKSDK
jgi:hypothetical protein